MIRDKNVTFFGKKGGTATLKKLLSLVKKVAKETFKIFFIPAAQE